MADAVEETRRLIGLGNEQILRVSPENFELTCTEAWPAFRRGVVRAEGCREVPAEELLKNVEGKAQVLTFLADFAEKKRGYRRQVETVLRVLLKGPAWLEVARADKTLQDRLPGEETKEMLTSATTDADSPVPAAVARMNKTSLPSTAEAAEQPTLSRTETRVQLIETLQSSFSTLGGSPQLDAAVPEFLRFSEAVSEVLSRNLDEDVKVLAELQPKEPVLRLLCSLHSKRRSERPRVNGLLFALMETASVSPWRAAAESDENLRNDLEGLGVLDHVYGNRVSDDSSDEKGVRGSKVSQACDFPSTSSTRQAIWMWRDAGVYAGWLSHSLATLNPARWSTPCSVQECIADLEQYLDTPSGERPVKVRVFGGREGSTSFKATTVAGAVASLRVLL